VIGSIPGITIGVGGLINVAALQTTVGDFGHRVMAHPYSKEAREEYLSQ
jgi:hypothetical protein